MSFVERLEMRRLFAAVPAGFSDTQFASSLTNPTAMEIAPDGRIFVAQQNGQIRVISSSGSLQSTPFVTLSVNNDGERGILGVTLDPNFSSNHFVYAYYTATSPTIHNRLSRFTANGNVAVAGSEVALLNLPNLGGAFHNGGAIHFGKDGKLYLGVGENVVATNSQSLSSPLGKILRINSDGTIPTDNPFFNQTSGINRAIWALGLRNPFTFNFQPGTGKMFINDVGQTSFEEIDLGIAGSNYGWPFSEGLKKAGDTDTTIGTYRDPIFNYGRDVGNVIAGGTFYNPSHTQFPSSYVGRYFFSDNGAGWIHQLSTSNTEIDFATGVLGPVDLRVGAGGALYYLQRGNGSIHRIQFTSISGIVFNDANGNGTKDAGESPIAGRSVYIDSNNNGVSDAGEESGITDANGLYVLGGLGAGSYVVRQQGGASLRETVPVGSHNVTLTTGQIAGGRNFGLTSYSPPAGPNGTETVAAVYHNGQFQFSNGAPSFTFGIAGDKPLLGDWNGDGVSDVGVYRGNQFILDSNTNHTLDGGDASFAFGISGDIPIAGKWKGGSVDRIGIFRNGSFWLDANGDHLAGANDIAFTFGQTGDIPLAGDWNGDGITDVGVRRGNAFILDYNGDHHLDTGDLNFAFGFSSDVPVAVPAEPGKPRTRIGVYRSGEFWLDKSDDHKFGAFDEVDDFGENADVPLVGRFNS